MAPRLTLKTFASTVCDRPRASRHSVILAGKCSRRSVFTWYTVYEKQDLVNHLNTVSHAKVPDIQDEKAFAAAIMARIDKLRRTREWTKSQLAREVNVTRQMMHNWSRSGKVRQVSSRLLNLTATRTATRGGPLVRIPTRPGAFSFQRRGQRVGSGCRHRCHPVTSVDFTRIHDDGGIP